MSYQVIKKFPLRLMTNLAEKWNAISSDEEIFSNFND